MYINGIMVKNAKKLLVLANYYDKNKTELILNNFNFKNL